MDSVYPHAQDGNPSPVVKSPIRHMTDEDKRVIESGQYSLTELHKKLGFSTRSIQRYVYLHNVVLPKQPKPAKNYHVIIGNKYGLLTPTERIVIDGKTHYRCTCDCGSVVVRLPRSLFTTRTPSCGCYIVEVHKVRRKEDGEASGHVVFLNYKGNAIRKNHEFLLTEEEFMILSQRNCFYCNCKPSRSRKRGNSATPFVYNGVDRIDSNKGYSLDNCVSCCTHCNIAKSDMTVAEFTDWIARVYCNMSNWVGQK